MDYSTDTNEGSTDYAQMKAELVADVRNVFGQLNGEVTERNARISKLDDYIYSDKLEKMLDIPIGHDFTPVNWLRRTVEIHKTMFMGRGFQVISTYDSQNVENVEDEEEKGRLKLENAKQKTYAEQRKQLIDSIMYDNGGSSFWATLAENASAVGTSAVKMYYDEDKKKIELCEIESVENLYVLWSADDFRKIDAVAYIHQVSVDEAVRDYGAPADVATSPLGSPFGLINTGNNGNNITGYGMGHASSNATSNQPMVTIMEVTGKVPGWGSKNGRCKKVKPGGENEINAMIVGTTCTWLIDDEKKLPHYYIFPNKRQRRRPWGVSDISDNAIYLNLTYIETLSDWRTHAAKVNFQKYRAFGFGADTQIPKYEKRQVQVIPLSEGQDLKGLDQGDANGQDFAAQMEKCEQQFVRETGISRVLFDDPSVTLNSNQALLTSMKPTSDIAEGKKQLWSPIITQMFQDALELVIVHNPKLKEVADPDENWSLKVMWPSLMQKEDPVYQQMLLNRFNATTMSLQSFLEAQGESKEELDRIRDELTDPVTAAILGRIVGQYAEGIVTPPQPQGPEVKTSINLRGDLTPNQEANIATQQGFNDGPFPPSAGPQGTSGLYAQENMDNSQFLTGNPRQGGMPVFRDQGGNPQSQGQKQDTSTGQDVNPQVNTQANNAGNGAVSLPGSGRPTPVGAQGALDQAAQQQGA